MWHIENMRQLSVLCLCAFLCPCLLACSREDARQAQAARERNAVDAVAEAVRSAPRPASTGRWDHPQLTQRLVDAGLAPRPDDSIPPHPDYRVTPVGYRVGSAHLLAWVYGDSLARRAVSASIDTLTAFPRAPEKAFAEPPVFVRQNNLMVVIVDGSERQRERIRLAIEAGLPPPP